MSGQIPAISTRIVLKVVSKKEWTERSFTIFLKPNLQFGSDRKLFKKVLQQLLNDLKDLQEHGIHYCTEQKTFSFIKTDSTKVQSKVNIYLSGDWKFMA